MAARLSFDERCVISAMVGVGASARQIADELGRHSSTVRREINRAGGRGVYRAEDAQTEAEVRARRPKVPKLVTDPQLAEAVTERLGACIHVCVRWVLYCCGWCESWSERR